MKYAQNGPPCESSAGFCLCVIGKNANSDKGLRVVSMGAPKGNDNASKGRMFFRALNRAIAQDDGVRLRNAAEKLLDLAAAGEAWAVKELADRLDGKATQVIDATVTRRAQELTDDELADIATGGGAGTADEAQSAGQPTGLH